MNTSVINTSEADSYLVLYEDWLDLDDEKKVEYIRRASIYIQTQWTCADVVWEDDPDTVEVESVDIPDEVKEAAAYYAYADFKSVLYGSPTDDEVFVGNLRSQKDKVGSLSAETTYFRGGSKSPSGTHKRLGYPDSLMNLHCLRNSSNILLVRV